MSPVLCLENMDIFSALFNLSTYHHPDNTILPTGYIRFFFLACCCQSIKYAYKMSNCFAHFMRFSLGFALDLISNLLKKMITICAVYVNLEL